METFNRQKAKLKDNKPSRVVFAAIKGYPNKIQEEIELLIAQNPKADWAKISADNLANEVLKDYGQKGPRRAPQG